ncbi:MAG: hypothetical protein ACRENV_04650 [Candidatus Dormibacteria bacterium]
MTEVVTTGEARQALHRIAKGFETGRGEPVYFGSHRRAQGVIVPVDIWEALIEDAENCLDTSLAAARIAGEPNRRLSRAEINNLFEALRAQHTE